MMKPISIWKQELADGVHTARLASLYCCAPEQTPAQAARYEAVLNGLEATFGTHAEAGLYSAPGRTEIGGNHTDHQHGRVLAGNLRATGNDEVWLRRALAAQNAGRLEDVFLATVNAQNQLAVFARTGRQVKRELFE